METLKVSLETYNVETVRGIAQRLGVLEQLANPTKSNTIHALLNAIPRFAASKRDLASLNEAERAVLALALNTGGHSHVADFMVPMVMSGLVSVEIAGDTINPGKPSLNQVVETLLSTGLLVNLSEPQGYGARRSFAPLDVVAIPPEVIQVIAKDALAVPQARPERFRSAEPAEIVHRPAEDFIRKIFFVWAELRSRPAKILKSGKVAKRDLQRLAQSVGASLEESTPHILNLIELTQATGLLEVDENHITVSDREQCPFWNQALPEQVGELLVALAKTSDVNFVDLSPLVNAGFITSTESMRGAGSLHQELLILLKAFARTDWFPVPLLWTLLNRGENGAFIFNPISIKGFFNQISWYSWQGQQEERKTLLATTLKTVEMTALAAMLQQWAELGAVDLGYEHTDQLPIAVRLSEAGCSALLQTPLTMRAAAGQVVLQPDFQLLALGPVPFTTLSSMEHLAEREDVQAAAVSYRLTKNSIYQALQSGDTIGNILNFLETETQEPVPQNIERTLREWSGQHERIVVHQDVMVVQVDTPERMAALLDDAKLKRYLHPLDDSTAWVESKSRAVVQRRLWELDIWPAVSRGPQADLPRSATWQEGMLRPHHALPSLYTSGVLHRIAEAEGNSWKLTPAKIKEAIITGYTIPEIVAKIEEISGVSLSPEWQKTLKAWGGYFGSAATAEVRLIKLASYEILIELRQADRRLARWLRPLEKGVSIAVINATKWDEVVEVLQEWGVSVDQGRWW
ncbi:MAG: helicase-associated domain-containing protein [Anaerolineae bacterium]|nr:helicase-associated domain-containing protein [Anaerolineae bacterium]